MIIAMSEASPLDDRGRVTVRREYRSHLGDRVVQVLTPHGVLLRPLGHLDTTKLPPALQASGEDAALEEVGT